MLKAMAETSSAKCGDLSLAYQVFGDGPIDLVFVGMMVSHLELSWTQPELRPSSISSPRSVAWCCSIKQAWGYRTQSRKFARWMIELTRSRPSWTPSASKGLPSSV
jgi:hypothetical protein